MELKNPTPHCLHHCLHHYSFFHPRSEIVYYHSRPTHATVPRILYRWFEPVSSRSPSQHPRRSSVEWYLGGFVNACHTALHLLHSLLWPRHATKLMSLQSSVATEVVAPLQIVCQWLTARVVEGLWKLQELKFVYWMACPRFWTKTRRQQPQLVSKRCFARFPRRAQPPHWGGSQL